MCLDERTPEAILTDAYNALAPSLRRHCELHLHNKEIAEEVAQEAFMRTWMYLLEGHVIDNMKTFLYRVADHLIIDEIRRRRRRGDLSLESLQDSGFDPGDDSQLPRMEHEIDVWKVLAGVRKNREQEYRILSMRFLRGMQHAEIATAMGMSPRTVAVCLHRLLKKMKSTKLY